MSGAFEKGMRRQYRTGQPYRSYKDHLDDVERIRDQEEAPEQMEANLREQQVRRTPKGYSKTRHSYIGATGREYLSAAHRADVEGENYDAPYPFGYWIPPEDSVNPNEDEPHDEAFNEWYGEGEEQNDPYLTDYWPSPVETGEPMDIAWQLLKEVYPPPNYTEVGGEDAALA